MEYVVFIVIGAVVLIGSAVASIAGNMIASELYDRAPSLASWLIDVAVQRLPEHERERYREEWLAHLNEHPGKLSQVWHSVGCFFGASAVARAVEAKRSTSYTRDTQHQIHQEQRIRECSSATASRRISGRSVPFEAKARNLRFTYQFMHKTIEILSVASEEINREADIVDHVKDFFASKLRDDTDEGGGD